MSELKCGLLVSEYAKLVIDERKLLKLRKREEHANSENHCADSTLYPWRYAYPYLSTKDRAAPVRPGSPAHVAAIEATQQAEFDAELEREMQANRTERRQDDSEADWY